MNVNSLMATALNQELKMRGIVSIGREECEEIIANVFERSATVANEALSARPRLGSVVDTKDSETM